MIGEAREWETVEYVADAVSSGRRKALIILGHVPWSRTGWRSSRAGSAGADQGSADRVCADVGSVLGASAGRLPLLIDSTIMQRH